jgi:hypothetical protein
VRRALLVAALLLAVGTLGALHLWAPRVDRHLEALDRRVWELENADRLRLLCIESEASIPQGEGRGCR